MTKKGPRRAADLAGLAAENEATIVVIEDGYVYLTHLEMSFAEGGGMVLNDWIRLPLNRFSWTTAPPAQPAARTEEGE